MTAAALLPVRPLLKWPGGKSSELSVIVPRIPSHGRYFEPFFGGGSVYFSAIDTETAYANDLHPDLMMFYRCVKAQCEHFFAMLDAWVTQWEKACLEEKNRMYYETRHRYNNTSRTTVSRAVDFFLIRELAYGGMFRVNSKGAFNVPFGRAYAYNKNLQEKVNRLRSEGVQAKMQRLYLYAQDFSDFMDEFDFEEDDFLFVDPPYDSSFSKYGLSDFDDADQNRLADRLYTFKGRFMLVCKRTPLTEKLYLHHTGFQSHSYECRYRFNIKGRFSRDSIHIVITNYDADF